MEMKGGMMLVKIWTMNNLHQNRMQHFVAAGIVYLLGVAIILVIKPTLMFTEDGDWKEFGIGRNVKTHTWMPFWFFAVLWALTSYILVSIVFSVYLPQKQNRNSRLNTSMNMNTTASVNTETVVELTPEEFEEAIPKPRRSRGKAMNLPDGYYLKNNSVTEGVPKYIYLGKGLPEDA